MEAYREFCVSIVSDYAKPERRNLFLKWLERRAPLLGFLLSWIGVLLFPLVGLLIPFIIFFYLLTFVKHRWFVSLLIVVFSPIPVFFFSGVRGYANGTGYLHSHGKRSVFQPASQS